MDVRAIAMTIPLALGLACAHQGGATTSSSDQPRSGGEQAQGTQPSGRGGQATGGEVSAEQLGRDPIIRPGPPIQGHAEDQVVIGEVAEATGSQVTIQTPQGDKRTLQIVPETLVQIDGMDADATDLAEGEPVRASFDVVDGQEVAVKIGATGTSAADHGASAADQGTSGSSSQGSGTTGQGTGSSSDQGAHPDAGWGNPPAPGSSGSSGGAGPSGSQR